MRTTHHKVRASSQQEAQLLPEQVTDLSTFHPQPGDFVLARLDHEPSIDTVKAIGENLRRAFPNNTVLVLAAGITLEAVGDEQLAALGLART